MTNNHHLQLFKVCKVRDIFISIYEILINFENLKLHHLSKLHIKNCPKFVSCIHVNKELGDLMHTKTKLGT